MVDALCRLGADFSEAELHSLCFEDLAIPLPIWATATPELRETAILARLASSARTPRQRAALLQRLDARTPAERARALREVTEPRWFADWLIRRWREADRTVLASQGVVGEWLIQAAEQRISERKRARKSWTEPLKPSTPAPREIALVATTWQQRYRILLALYDGWDVQCLDTIREWRDDTHLLVRVLTAGLLAQQGDESGLPEILAVAESKNLYERAEALRTLWRLSPARFRELFVRVVLGEHAQDDNLHDDPAILQAIWGLTQLRGRAVRTALVQAYLLGVGNDTQGWIASALGSAPRFRHAPNLDLSDASDG